MRGEPIPSGKGVSLSALKGSAMKIIAHHSIDEASGGHHRHMDDHGGQGDKAANNPVKVKVRILSMKTLLLSKQKHTPDGSGEWRQGMRI